MKEPPAAAAVATRRTPLMTPIRHRSFALLSLGFALLVGGLACAEVLPPDEADVMYKHYEGGGIKADGPAYLVRKSVTANAAVTASYEVDQVTGASIDSVVSGASPIREERKQKSLSAEYLSDRTTYSVAAISSVENDYDASTLNGSIAQTMFGDLTTVTMSASKGWDIITRRIKDPTAGVIRDPTFRARLDRRQWSVGISQVITRNLIMALNLEQNTSQGYEQNPYRSYRYVDPTNLGLGYSFAAEVYPTSRTSDAVALKAKYYLPWHAVISGGLKYYTDNWGIRGQTLDAGYAQPFWHDRFTADLTLRYYTQSAASFYADLFPHKDAQNYLARDRELSSLSTQSVSGMLTYELPPLAWRVIKRSTLSLSLEELFYRYRNFRNATYTTLPADLQPLYSNNAFNALLLAQFYY